MTIQRNRWPLFGSFGHLALGLTLFLMRCSLRFVRAVTVPNSVVKGKVNPHLDTVSAVYQMVVMIPEYLHG